MLFNSSFVFNSWLVGPAENGGTINGFTLDKAKKELKYFVVRNINKGILNRSLSGFHKIEIMWLEVNIKDYKAKTTLQQAFDREGKSLDHRFTLASLK